MAEKIKSFIKNTITPIASFVMCDFLNVNLFLGYFGPSLKTLEQDQEKMQGTKRKIEAKEVRARKRSKPSEDLANIISFSSTMKLDELPPELFDYIMFLVGFGRSFESLNTCRQVCSSWNNRIMRSLWENPNRQWGPIIRRRLERSWDITLPSEEKISKALELEADGILPSAVLENLAEQLREKLSEFLIPAPTYPIDNLQDVRCAASLGNKGLLGNVEALKLWDTNLSSVPAKNLASLLGCVRCLVTIGNVRGCDLFKMMESVRCKNLFIEQQSLNSEETKTLVKALETYLEFFWWEYGEQEDTLDTAAMTQYSGLGKCKQMIFKKGAKYKEQFRTWAEGRDWEMFELNDDKFHLIRN